MIIESGFGLEGDDKSESKEPECAAKGCNKVGTIRLKVLFLNKWLRFCDECGKSLIKDELVFSESLNLGIGEGRLVERKEPLYKEGNR